MHILFFSSSFPFTGGIKEQEDRITLSISLLPPLCYQAAAMSVPVAYQGNTSLAVADWLNKGDNAWQMISATLVGMQSMPGLVILYGSIVKKKWAVNSAFMALYAFAAVWICWVTWAYNMSFGDKLLPFWGKAKPALGQKFLIKQAALPATTHHYHNGTVETDTAMPYYPMASMVYFQCVFAAITLILLAGSLLGRMNFRAWMLFVPLWLTFSYTIGAFSLWGGGFLYHWGVIDYSGGYVIHLSSGIAGITAAYWVGPRSTKDRERFPPNNVLLMLTGAGLLWMGWAGFNGGDPYSANIDSSLAVLNTNICAATSLLVWTCLDVIFFKKPSVIGAVQGMITGLVCITPGAGLVQGWAAIVMGVLSGSIPWFTMMIVHKRSRLLQKVDDTLGVFHTHAFESGLAKPTSQPEEDGFRSPLNLNKSIRVTSQVLQAILRYKTRSLLHKMKDYMPIPLCHEKSETGVLVLLFSISL
ncbi:hypothetical protein Cni_G24843 [Canna indica]|uniref:Ammonium transporter AmtB-like domain-containing protein n=1 Tax=Canna indica TaxID=4628 RepID=A0AAQ3L0W2_9LILI|nr:hypothetical protein Cni_G24843 [Canna indica]